MKILFLICRILLGLMFFVFGLNGFLHFLPMKGAFPADALTWMGIMISHTWMTVIFTLEVGGGLLVLSGVMLPLGIALLCPITFNILMFHLLLQAPGIGFGLAAAIFEIVLIYAYRPYFTGLLSTKAQPVLSRTL